MGLPVSRRLIVFPDGPARSTQSLDQRELALTQRRFEGIDRRSDAYWASYVVNDGLLSFEAIAGDVRDSHLVGTNLTGRRELLQAGDSHASRSLGENSFGTRQQLDAVDDLVVGRGFTATAGLVDDLQTVVAVGRISDRQRLGDRVWPDRSDGFGSLDVRCVDRRAAHGLCRAHASVDPIDQSDLVELVVSLPELGEKRARGDGRDDVVWRAPAKLLGDLEGQGLASFGVVGAEIDVDECPAILIRDLGAEAVDVIVVSVDGNDRRLVDGGPEDLSLLEVGRDEDTGTQTGARGVRGDGAGKITRRCASKRVETELDCPGAGDRDRVIFEGVRRIYTVILDVELAEAKLAGEVIRAHERCIAAADVDEVFPVDGEQGSVAPDAPGSGGDRLARDVGADGRVIIVYFEGAEAVLADVDGLGGI